MSRTFLTGDKPMLTVMLQCKTPEIAAGRIRNALCLGADAFGLQTESLQPEYRDPAVYDRLFKEMRGKPSYVTNYRSGFNKGKSDEELAEGLLELADHGAVLCDVMGDLFCRHPDELTEDETAVQRQKELIGRLHEKGAQVLISSHLYRFAPAERVMQIAAAQKERGADIVKIVTSADSMEQQMENLRITALLKKELGAPFLFLSGGVCSIHRRIGIHLGCCMALCVYEHDAFSTAAQPLLQTMKTLRDGIDF